MTQINMILLIPEMFYFVFSDTKNADWYNSLWNAVNHVVSSGIWGALNGWVSPPYTAVDWYSGSLCKSRVGRSSVATHWYRTMYVRRLRAADRWSRISYFDTSLSRSYL